VPNTPPPDIAERSIALASDIMTAAALETSRAERRKQRRLMRLLDDAKAFGLTIAITDRVLRVPASARSADLFADAVDHFGTGSSFGPLDRTALPCGIGVFAAGVRQPRHGRVP
jgi:hypothetical protein